MRASQQSARGLTLIVVPWFYPPTLDWVLGQTVTVPLLPYRLVQPTPDTRHEGRVLLIVGGSEPGLPRV